jgi:hypothetical protein
MARRIARAASSVAALLTLCAVAGAQVPGERPPPVSVEVGEETPQTQSAICNQPSGTFRTNRVIVRGRWAGKVDLPLKPGDPLTAENASAALNKLREEISSHSSNRYFNSVGEVHVLKVSGECGDPQPDGSVDFILEPRYVGLSAVRIGDNVLPIPRWREPAPYDDIPPIVRTLLPALGAAYDDVAGTSLTVAINPTLFHQPRTASSPVERDLTAQIAATHSLDESLYSDEARLAYTWEKSSDLLRGGTLSMHYARERAPLGDRRHDSDSRGAAVGAVLKLRPNTRLYVDAGYDREHEELSASATSERTVTSEDETSMRVLFEAIPPSVLGFARASLWANDADGYQRLVARMAYGKEFSLTPNQTVGVEVTLGAGRAWGDVPEYARFRGGSARQEFLYDGASSATMLEMPEGPTLRSFGENAAGLPDATQATRGATRFWHANLDIALPVPRWSMPLVPNESADITDASGEPLTIKQMMLNQVKSGPNFLQPVLVQRGMSPAEAKREADKIFAEVMPAARYVINDANVFSIKPMLLLDVAGLSDASGSETWVAAGLGVQVTVVTAKFEAGYSRTLHGPTFDSRGAPFARLVFQRLF